MKKLIFALVFCTPLFAGEYLIDRTEIPFELDAEAVLEVRYKVECPENVMGLRGLHADITIGNRKLRLELPAAIGSTQAQLGRLRELPLSFLMTVREDSDCTLKQLKYVFQNVSAEKEFYRRLALEHSPVLHIRDAQYENRLTDLPLALAYSILDKDSEEAFTLRYTVIYSDEDDKSSGMDRQWARYGRTSDIEWAYEIKLRRKDMTVLDENFHGSLALGIGYATAKFTGSYLEKTKHPLLYNLSGRNNHHDSASKKQGRDPIAYHLAPLEEIPQPLAREQVMFNHPWMFKICDDECLRERKLTTEFQDQLFVRIRGKLTSGSLVAVFTTADGTVVKSGADKGNVDRLGEDLWEKESYTAIPIGKERLAGEIKGTLTLEGSAELALEEIGIYRLKMIGGRLIAEEVKPMCSLNGMKSRCVFK